jgi:hypothetical protein
MFASMRITGFRNFLCTCSGHIILSFIRTQPCVKRKPLKTEELPVRSHSVFGRFYCIYISFLYAALFVYITPTLPACLSVQPTLFLSCGARFSTLVQSNPGPHPPSSSAEGKERVERHLYFPSKPSWSVLG